MQNDWKVRPNFTLNLGLRYEYFTPLREKEGRLSNLVFGSNGLINSRVVVVDRLFEPDRNNFAPRLGFTYSPTRFDNKAVVRGGFGIAYNRVPNVLFDNARGNPPFFARNSLCCGSATNPFAGNTILYTTGSGLLGYPINPALARGIDPATGGVRGSTVEIYGTPSEEPNSYVYLYSLDLQYELPFQLQATLGYQGSAGHKLIRIVNQNFIYANNPAFNPVFFLQPDVNSNYNAMNARLMRRLSKGVQFDLIYRWAKSIDTLSYEGPGFVTNQTFPQDLSTERGPSDYDTRHYLTFSALWDIPIFRTRTDLVGTLLGGWQINGIYTWNTGFPWTPVTNRPALVTPGGRNLSPIRPIAYFGGALDETDDEAFIRPGGNFPGGGERYFAITGTAQRPGIGRNSFRGPTYSSLDLSLVKLFKISETSALDVRANFFNAFNWLNLQQMPFGSAGAVIENPNFGRSPAGLAGRVIEFQARIYF